MTEEEKIELFKLCFPNNHSMTQTGMVGFIDYFLELPDYECNSLFEELVAHMPFSSSTTATTHLLSKSFDLFGLIEKGLAIESDKG